VFRTFDDDEPLLLCGTRLFGKTFQNEALLLSSFVESKKWHKIAVKCRLLFSVFSGKS